MQLLYSPTSPYARKCRVVARERGLIPGIEEVDCNPHEDPAELHAKNPLGRVPTLVLDDGRAVFDSPVICELLEGLGSAPPLVPGVGQGKFQVLVAAALAQGMTDSAVNMVMESRRPEGERSSAAVERWRASIQRGLDSMMDYLAVQPEALTLGHIACGCTLGYLDLRHGDMAWRDGRGTLADWFEAFSARPAMQETKPG